MDPTKLQGDVGRPFGPEPEKQDEKIDPEKFKKVLKIDESDEAQKRHKRKLKKEEEEGEDEEDVQEKAPTPSTSFSEFMDDKEELDNVFDAQSAGIRRREAPKEPSPYTSPPKGSISTEGVEVEEEPSFGEESAYAAPPPPEEGAPPPPSQEPAGAQAGQQPPPQQQPPPEQPPGYEGIGEQEPFPSGQSFAPGEEPLSPEESESSFVAPPTPGESQKEEDKGQEGSPQKEEDTSLLASQPKKAELSGFKKKKPKKMVPEEKIVTPSKALPGEEKIPVEGKPTTKAEGKVDQEEPLFEAPEPGKKAEVTTPGLEQAPLDVGAEGLKKSPTQEGEERELALPAGATPTKTQTGEPLFRKLSPEEVRKQKKEQAAAVGETIPGFEGLNVAAATTGEKGEGKKDRDKEKGFIEANPTNASIPLPAFENPLAAVSPVETPSYTKLSPEVYELFEKTAGVILIQQDTGKTSTTVTINMPNTVFDGSQLILDQYSTAPMAYNIQLTGSPEAVKAFQTNLDSLSQAFKEGQYNFEVNILNPVLQGRGKKHLIQRKSAAGDKGGGGGGGQQKRQG